MVHDLVQQLARRTRRFRSVLRPALTLLLFWAALWALDRVLANYHFGDVVEALRAIPLPWIGLAVIAAAAGYVALVGYDYLAFRYAGRPLPWRTMMVPSFMTFAVANSAPASAATAGGLRFRLYASRGLTAAGAAIVAIFNVITYALGLFALGGLLLVLRPVMIPHAPQWIAGSGRLVGVLLLAAVAAYLILAAVRRSPVTVAGRTFRIPPPRLALAQLGMSTADWVLSSGALYLLLTPAAHVTYPQFLSTYLVAQATTLIVPLPGGIGVFEAMILVLLPGEQAAPAVLAALLLYRVIYFLAPLVMSGLLLGARQLAWLRRQDRPVEIVLERLSAATPHILSLATFGAGALLLATGAIPGDEWRLAWLNQLLPPVVTATSHFLASVVGAALLIIAWGLERRIRRAYQLARVLYSAGIAFALLRSLDIGVAALLGVALLIIQLASREFPRTESMLREPLSAGWIVAIGAAVATIVWLGSFVHQHAVADVPWWRFALYGPAPAYVRAAVAGAVVLVLFALARFLNRSGPQTS